MADSQPTEPATGSNPNTHFFRPNDGIYVSEGAEHRTICVSPHLPTSMSRNGTDWHVEQFELHKELYRGKTSLLYMATDRISGVQVALKLYRKRKLSVLNRYQVEREVRLHINLHHENIIHLFAAFEDEKHVYMVQEFAVCGDLFEDLKKGGGQLKEKYAVRDVIVPFLSALSYLHGMGIIHRDIKPENILLGANKTIKVADFGLSINIHHERPVTRAGTLDYMAPEVLVCPDKRRPEENKDKVLLGYTAQVDSWAVGILAYELLVGYPPFEQESRAATYEHIMYKEAKFPSWMSEEARRFIGLALCKNASQRPTIADLLTHAWVQPYLVRHPPGVAGSTGTAGPSRLRNSVSMAIHDTTSGAVPAASSTSSQPAQPARASSVSVHSASQPLTGSGMTPAPPAGAASVTSSLMGAGGGGGGGARVVVQLPGQPPVQRSSSHMVADSSSPKHAAGGGGASPGVGTLARSPQPHSHAHGAAGSPATGAGAGGLGHGSGLGGGHGGAGGGHGGAGGGHGGAGGGQPYGVGTQSLNTSTSLKVAMPPGSQDPITGSESRLHDSISDPTIRSFEPTPPPPHHLMPSQPPGAVSSAALMPASRSGGGAPHGCGADGLERAHSGLGGLVGSGSSAYVLGGARTPAALGGPSQGNMASRLGLSSSHSISRPSPPPLALSESTEAMSSDASCAGDSYAPMPLSPSGLTPAPPGRSGLGSAGGPRPGSGAAGPGTPPAPGLRHRLVPPGINTANLGMGGSGAGGGAGRLPAPPASPKPLTPDLGPGFHRPASGVLSDDSFLPPARSPSMSVGAQHLSPLQAALLAPRPSISRLNSPSHSRRNSLSQAGNVPGTGGTSFGGPSLPLHSTPLPQLSPDYGADSSAGGLYAEDSARNSASHKYVIGGIGSAGATGGANGSSARMLGKLWPGAGGGGGGGGLDSPMDMPSSSAASFSSRGGGGGGAAGANASPMARSAAAARVRMMTPEDLRPLMRESSISSGTPKGSGAGGDLRSELAQPSMTVYNRPGKVPGVGRAAIAAREAEAAEAAASLTAAGNSLNKTKSLVNRNLNGVLGEDGPSGLARMGSDVALARTAAGQAAAASAAPAVASQRSFTGANSAFARKLANGAIATKVTEYVKGRLPHDEDMDD